MNYLKVSIVDEWTKHKKILLISNSSLRTQILKWSD
jgi:hypothetical protein